VRKYTAPVTQQYWLKRDAMTLWEGNRTQVVRSDYIVLYHPRSWVSAHRGKWGQLTRLEKWMKIKKQKHAKKEQFSMFMLYFESNQERQM